MGGIYKDIYEQKQLQMTDLGWEQQSDAAVLANNIFNT